MLTSPSLTLSRLLTVTYYSEYVIIILLLISLVHHHKAACVKVNLSKATAMMFSVKCAQDAIVFRFWRAIEELQTAVGTRPLFLVKHLTICAS